VGKAGKVEPVEVFVESVNVDVMAEVDDAVVSVMTLS
jgi:hypothetical protein